MSKAAMVSVVTPTFRRPDEVVGLIENLRSQTDLPLELVLVDGAPAEETATEVAVRAIANDQPFRVVYVRHGGGTAIQRNVGIDRATGRFIAFVDDDIRLEPDFLRVMTEGFAKPGAERVGGIVGYRSNKHFSSSERSRWRWYKRLGLLKTFEPGRYDFLSGYPINANLQPPFSGFRKVDFMTTSCAVWRSEVFAAGLRFDAFFRDYGVLEDAHLSLRAGRQWELLQCGDARCTDLVSPHGRVNRHKLGYKCVVNYYYVFQDIVGPLTWAHRFRFWRFQIFELLRVAASAVRTRSSEAWSDVLGRLEGFRDIFRRTAFHTTQS